MKKYLFHPLTLIIFFIVIFFAKQIFFGSVFYCCDNLAINVPSKVLLVENIRKGIFPLWNQYILSGSPFLADINLGLLYPLNIFYFLFSPFRALTIGIIVDFAIAAIGMYILAQSLKLSQFASTIASIILTFSGTLIVYTNNVPMLQVAVLLPWIMWSWFTYFYHPTKKFFLILVGLLSLQIIGGHPQLTYHTWLLGIAYVIFVSPLSIKKRIIGLLSVGGLVFLLSSIQIVPFLEFAHASTRVGRGFNYASFDSLNPFNMLRFIIPLLVGNLSAGTDWLQGGSVYGYVGVVPIILALFVPLKNIHVRFFLLATIISLVLALGKYTPIFLVAYKLIPGLGNFRSPQHFLYLYTFSLALLAGFGIDEALRPKRIKIFLSVLFGMGIIFLVLGVWWIEWGIYPLMIIPKFRLLAPDVRGEVILLIVENLFFTGILLFIMRFVHTRAIFLFVVFLELFLFSRDGLISVNEQKMSLWLQSGKILANRMQDGAQYRMFVSPTLYANPVKKQFGVPYVEKETEWQMQIMRTNINMLYHLSTIDGYASLIDRSYKEFFQKEELFQKGEGDPTGIEFGDMTNINWNTLGVRYVLARSDESIFKKNPTFIRVWADRNKVLYQNPNALRPNPVIHQSKSIIFGFWLTVGGLIIYSSVLMYARGRKT